MQPELGTFHSRLGRLLYDLLYEAETRERFLAGEPITDDEDERRALAVIELDELRDAGGRIRRDLLAGSGDMAGGLGSAYKRTLAAMEAAGVDVKALADAYLRSPEFGRFRELPAGGPAWCAEEAYYRYHRTHCGSMGLRRGADACGAAARVPRRAAVGARGQSRPDLRRRRARAGPSAGGAIRRGDLGGRGRGSDRAQVGARPTHAGAVRGDRARLGVRTGSRRRSSSCCGAGSWPLERFSAEGETPPPAMAAAAERLIEMGLLEGEQ